MTFWKNIKDRAALDRLEDEAFHAAAVDEIGSGRRRDGLWAKAVIESGGDEVKAKIAYLRLLVVALRDENYLNARASELQPSQPTTYAPPRPEHAKPNPESIRLSIQQSIDAIRTGRATYENYAELLAASGGSIEAKGFIFGMHYVVSYKGRQVRVSRFEDLQSWFMTNVIPSL